MNTWEAVVVTTTAIGLMPRGIRASICRMLEKAMLSRVITLALVLLSGCIVWWGGDAGVAAGIALFAANMVRRSGGRSALLFSAIAITGAASFLVLATFNTSYHALGVGLVWFALALIFLKGVAFVCDEDSRLNKLPAVGRECVLVIAGAIVYYIQYWIALAWSTVAASWSTTSVLIWLCVAVAIVEIVGSKRGDVNSEISEQPEIGRSGETTSISCFDLMNYYRD